MTPANDLKHFIRESHRLLSTGPTTSDYLRWRDGVDELLCDLVGSKHPIRDEFRTAVGPFDVSDANGLQLHGEYGMHGRINRGKKILKEMLEVPSETN